MREKVFVKNKKDLKLAAVVEKRTEKGFYPGAILLHCFKGYDNESVSIE